ncbi:MAG: HAMP domain-containing sensor histidine kinase [Roseiflexaceae bacterium]
MAEPVNNLLATSNCSLAEQRILLLAPTGKDARLSQSFLTEAGLDCTVCPNIAGMCVQLEAGAGVLVVTEEALTGEGMRQLQAALAHQLAWSDVPIVVLTSGGNSAISAYALENLGNVMLLDRPVQIATLVSTVRTALRARLRQYQIREHLHEREQAALERERLYAAEQRARAQAEAALRTRDEFLSIAAHELKTPLTTLMGNIDLIQRRARREGGLSERDTRSIEVATQQARRLKQLIDSLLDLSRLELGQLSIEPEPLDLGQLARRVVEEVQPGLLQHSIICRMPDTAVMIDGDEIRLEQVIQNLLQNAVRYSPNGGRIEVLVAADEQSVLASLQVRDQGIGIAAEALAQLFERFYRVPDTMIEHIHGVGIGLYVVREIITLHGGAVEVASEAGVGSTFTVNLPLRASYRVEHGEHTA